MTFPALRPGGRRVQIDFLVPSDLNNNVPHLGGASEARSR